MKKDSKKNWRKKAREFLAAAFGGKCTICGYDKTIAALDYHHVDPKSKDLLLCIAMRNGYSWSKIVEEARKCTILCCRCHREVHAGVAFLPENCAKFNEEYADVMKLRCKEFDKCPECGKEKNKRFKYCSTGCSSLQNRRFNPSKDELVKLIEQNPYEEIGKMFGVSGNAVRNRCKLLGITLQPRRGYWAKARSKKTHMALV